MDPLRLLRMRSSAALLWRIGVCGSVRGKSNRHEQDQTLVARASSILSANINGIPSLPSILSMLHSVRHVRQEATEAQLIYVFPFITTHADCSFAPET